MKKIADNNQGQALLLIIVVLFIVFFLVVSLSENISLDSLNTNQNQNFQKSFSAASSGINAAKAAILANPGSPASTGTCNYGTGTISYQCAYTITAQQAINQSVLPDQTVQADVSGGSVSTGPTQVQYNDTTGALVLNIINIDGTNVMCLFYPSGFVGFNSTSQPPSGCGSTSQQLSDPDPKTGLYTISIPYNNNQKFIRAMILDTSSSKYSNIIITPGTGKTQEYKIVATGAYGGSRRIISTYYNVSGAPPAIFDHVLFNGGSGATISF